jgi:hypothetical protein
VAVVEQVAKFSKADELRRQAEGVLQLEGLPDRLAAGQKKKMIVIASCGASSSIGQPRRAEIDDALFHGGTAGRRPGRAGGRSALTCWPLELAQHLVAALDGVVERLLGDFLPASASSISSSIMSRICTKLPKRRPLELAVGALLVSCFSGDSSPGSSRRSPDAFLVSS